MISIIVVSKDEPNVDVTLGDILLQADALAAPVEIIVVDASEGRLDTIRLRYAPSGVTWIQFEPPLGVRVSIPHQRNTGVRAATGEIVVFTDAGCRPESGWLERLVTPLYAGEYVTAGSALAPSGKAEAHGRALKIARRTQYLSECPTINLAFQRSAFEAVNGFDEQFAYGSDIDFSWRLISAGYRIRSVPDAIVRHDWGDWRRQLRRSYSYGKARVRLYLKHRRSIKHLLSNDPVVIVYPLFLLFLPLTFVIPFYPALLLIPAFRNRSDRPGLVVLRHLSFGAGVLAELISR